MDKIAGVGVLILDGGKSACVTYEISARRTSASVASLADSIDGVGTDMLHEIGDATTLRLRLSGGTEVPVFVTRTTDCWVEVEVKGPIPGLSAPQDAEASA